MMQDPEANFFDVQHAFEIYWKDREITRSNGWKQYKRWEYMMQNRIRPDGTLPAPDHVWKEYFEYQNQRTMRENYGSWVNLGPFDVPTTRGYQGLGRINALAFDPFDPDIIYIGAPSGGLWKTSNYGNTWTPLTDMLPTLGVSSIVVDFTNPDVIYIGTGDRDAGDAPGLGVMKSTDNGITWFPATDGIGNRTVGRLIMYPGDASIILAATSGGVYKTLDGGQTWYRTLTGDHKDILFKTDNPMIVFSSAGGKLYRSDDLGENWIQITNGIVSGSRGVIGVTPADPDVVYFLTTTSSSYKGIYRSVDGGLSFTEMSTSPNIMSWGCNGGSGGQAWYDLDMAVDEQDANTVYAGGVNCFKSTDGGATWFIVSHWWGDCGVPAVHADLHVLEYNPHDGRLFAGNDGGIYFSINDGISWVEISNGLAISQTYKLGQSATVKDLVINGYQDNGTSTYTGSSWLAVNGGDGMECAFDHQDATYSYSTIYYGAIYRHLNHFNVTKIAGQGVGNIDESGAWVTPFILHEANPAIMFAGYKNVWRSNNVKTGLPVWKKISSDESSNCSVLEQSPADVNILYVVRGSTLQRTDDAMNDAPVWISLSNFLPGSGSVSDVEAHPFEPDIVYITRGNRVYRSTDRGISWTDMTGSLPDIYISGIAFYKNSQEGLYVGTDAGIYYRDLSLDDWVQFSNGFPVAGRVSEIEIYYDPEDPASDMIRASTYGRGLWESSPYHGMPAAAFTASETTVPAGCAINFTDLSTGVPTSWNWTFEGSTTPTSIVKNPTGIVYQYEGVYTVKLVVSNPVGTDSLIMTDYITVSSAITPYADFGVDNRSFCSNDAIASFYDSSLYCPIAWEWSFDPNTVAFIQGTTYTSQNPVVMFSEPGNYAVTLQASNQNGSSSTTRPDYIMVGGGHLPFSDDFESGIFSSNSWSIDNPDSGKTWEISAVGGASHGDMAARVNIYTYFALPYQRDRLISPPFNLTDYPNAYLTFQHAYAQKYPSISDSLIIYISADCGETWIRIFAGGDDGSGSFATHPRSTDEFIPQNTEDWCGAGYGSECYTVDISGWTGNQDVRIMFESYNFLGNNIYIDNVSIFTTVAIADTAPVTPGFSLYPNPANGIITLTGRNAPRSLIATILNLTGQVIYSEEVRSTDGNLWHHLNLEHLSKGVYIIRFDGASLRQFYKLILN